MQTQNQTLQIQTPQAAVRRRRVSTAVIAQYIQDLTHPGQASRILAARTAALRALSTPTHATGTPGGI